MSQANRDAVQAASQAGFTVALCTGRSVAAYLPTALDLGIAGLYLVGCNGAVVYRLDAKGAIAETLFETQLSDMQVERISSLGRGRALKVDVGALQVDYPCTTPATLEPSCDVHIT